MPTAKKEHATDGSSLPTTAAGEPMSRSCSLRSRVSRAGRREEAGSADGPGVTSGNARGWEASEALQELVDPSRLELVRHGVGD